MMMTNSFLCYLIWWVPSIDDVLPLVGDDISPFFSVVDDIASIDVVDADAVDDDDVVDIYITDADDDSRRILLLVKGEC